MIYTGIVVVTDNIKSCVQLLKQFNEDYEIIKHYTNDEEYQYPYINSTTKDKALYEWNIGENFYSIPYDTYMSVVDSKKIPLILLPENNLLDFRNKLKNSNLSFMCVFICFDNKVINDKNKVDVFKNCEYTVCCNDNVNTINYIDKMWKLQGSGGGLSRDLIEKMVSCNLLIVDGKKENVSNSSYDLSLGDEYYYAGEIKRLDERNPFIAIEPYDYVIASCDEKINMPRDVSARFDVSVNLFCQGIILSNSTQVDPGFRGKLFCLLFNTSNKVVYLKRKMHYVTLEFNKLVEPTTAYDGKYADENSIVPYLPINIMQGAINELKKEIESLKVENKKMQSMYLSVLSILLTLISIISVFR